MMNAIANYMESTMTMNINKTEKRREPKGSDPNHQIQQNRLRRDSEENER